MREPITLIWPGGEDDFLFPLGQLEALDDRTESGVLDYRYRLWLGQGRSSLAFAPVRVRETLDCLRLGLIGAGMDRAAAEKKVRIAFEDGDISVLNLVAFTALSHSLSGKEHDEVGGASGEATAEEDLTGSDFPPSTATAP